MAVPAWPMFGSIGSLTHADATIFLLYVVATGFVATALCAAWASRRKISTAAPWLAFACVTWMLARLVGHYDGQPMSRTGAILFVLWVLGLASFAAGYCARTFHTYLGNRQLAYLLTSNAWLFVSLVYVKVLYDYALVDYLILACPVILLASVTIHLALLRHDTADGDDDQAPVPGN